MQISLAGLSILITGGLGFVGSNIAHACLRAGAKVTIFDCLDPRSGGNMHNVDGIENEVEIVLNDIRNFDGVCSCIRKKDILFHCAAYTSHPNSMKEPFVDIDVNCKGTIHVLEAAKRFNHDVKVIHVGTSTQIGRMRHSPIDELHVEFPIDIYSANKTASEKYVLIYGSAYKMRTSVLRLANTFGPRSNIRDPEFGFMNYFIGLALLGKDLPVFGQGGQMRSVSFVDDSVTALIMAAQSDAANGQVFFAVGDVQYSVAEIANAIARNVGGRTRFVPWPKDRATIEVGDAIISNSKIKSALGWSPQWSLDDGLKKTREYFRPVLIDYLETIP